MPKSHWSIDKRIPIAVIVTVFIQIVAVIAWATTLDARVGIIEEHDQSNAGVQEKLARLEERLDNLKHDLGDIKRQIERLTVHLIGK